MPMGNKIKELRIKSNLTQKDLADKLFVTYQAVSRWENDETEPSADTLKKMTEIFNCTLDDLFGIEKKEEPKVEEQPKVIEKVVVQEAKPVLGVCEKCNKAIFEPADLIRYNLAYTVRESRHTRTEHRIQILCKSCNEKRLAEEKRKKEEEEKKRLLDLKKRRIHSFIWPTLLAILFIAVAIKSFIEKDAQTGGFSIALAIFGYTFLATMILNNTFITDLWYEVASWGFVKMPGVIFEFSIDGFVFLIAIKILFFILGILLALAAAAFATALAALLSVFAYPFALSKNLKNIK